jgi:DNA-binding NarL/FixJ family response regulator
VSRSVGSAIGLDVHRDFCEVAIVEEGVVRSAGRIETTPEQLEMFTRSLGPEDRVALDVTGGAWEIARILEPYVRRVVVVSPDDTGIRQARANRASYPSAAIVAFSSTDAPEVRDAFLTAGADAFVDKRDVRGFIAAVLAIAETRTNTRE